VTFDEVGGLDDRTYLPCLHFTFNLIFVISRHPFPRGDDSPPTFVPRSFPALQCYATPRSTVPWSPRTGKTLLVRALAASCRKDGKQICKDR
jgi:hypothetical protein